ncbi:putative membrane protein [Halomicrobium sp. LC1Hm]|nr:putative membrane protein [Halomicrobium sp. LC1Hm]
MAAFGRAFTLCLSALGWTWTIARSTLVSGTRKGRSLLSGPVKRGLAGPVRDALLGRRVAVSLLAGLLSAPLALLTTWWVRSTMGYTTLEAWVRGTWYGTEPALVVFLGVAALLVLATASAAVNSGLVPTTLLVAGPVFGVGVARYGTTVTYEYGASVVSLPDAVAIAALFAVAFGTPIAVCGFVLGSALRRVTAVLADGAGPLSRVADS